MSAVAYLGPEGSYSHLAVDLLAPSAKKVAFSSFPLVVGALLNGECNLAVLPIENSLNGAVLANIDLLQQSQGLVAGKTARLGLDHRLAYLDGADMRGISRIYSHEQPLAQCAEYLFKNFPAAQLIATQSTTASLEKVKTFADAAIVGAHVKMEGITLSPRNIADFPHNYTDFLLVKKGVADVNAKTDRIFFSVTCRHSSGALLGILEPLRSGGLNMTKIQSRPIKGSAGEYRFFIEVEGDYSSETVRKVLEGVENISNSFKILGAYLSDGEHK